jgi:hypothetical protein
VARREGWWKLANSVFFSEDLKGWRYMQVGRCSLIYKRGRGTGFFLCPNLEYQGQYCINIKLKINSFVPYRTVPPYGTIVHHRYGTVPYLQYCQFSGLQDSVPRQHVPPTRDEGMHVESWGFLAWRTNERHGSQSNYYRPIS